MKRKKQNKSKIRLREKKSKIHYNPDKIGC